MKQMMNVAFYQCNQSSSIVITSNIYLYMLIKVYFPVTKLENSPENIVSN